MKTTLLLLTALFASCTPQAQTNPQLALEQTITTLVGTIEKMPKIPYLDPNLARKIESNDTTGILHSNSLVYTNMMPDSFTIYRNEYSDMLISYKSSGNYFCFNFVEEQQRKYRFEKYNGEIKLSYFEAEATGANMWGDPIHSFVEKSYTLNGIYDGFLKNIHLWNELLGKHKNDSSYLHLSYWGYYLSEYNEDRISEPVVFTIEILEKATKKVLLHKTTTISSGDSYPPRYLGTLDYVIGKNDSKDLQISVSYDQDKDHGGGTEKAVTISGKSTFVDFDIENNRRKSDEVRMKELNEE